MGRWEFSRQLLRSLLLAAGLMTYLLWSTTAVLLSAVRSVPEASRGKGDSSKQQQIDR